MKERIVAICVVFNLELRCGFNRIRLQRASASQETMNVMYTDIRKQTHQEKLE